MLARIRTEIDAAITQGEDLAALGDRLLALYPHLPTSDLAAVLGEAFFALTLAGAADLAEGR